MSSTNIYQVMKQQGLPIQDIIVAARIQGDDELTILGNLRNHFGLTLKQAKKELLGDSDPFEAPQDVVIGETVYWEGWDSISGSYIKSGIVKSVEADNVLVEKIKIHQMTPDGPTAIDYFDEPTKTVPRKYFNKSLVERLGENSDFLRELLGK